MKYMDGKYNYLAYARFHRKGQCVILINNNDHELTKSVTVWEAGIPRKGNMITLIQTDENGYTLEQKKYEIVSGKITITLPKTSGTILKYKKETE